MASLTDEPTKHSIFAPLRHVAFLRIWLASLATNCGFLIQGVGAAWAMTQLTSSVQMVALVQTAAFMPSMLLSLGSGAIADMFDRRVVAIAALSISLLAAALLSVFAVLGLVTPNSLLVFCFCIGAGMALLGPAWQASVREQVPMELVPQAISMNSISFNIARSVGPAIGGVLVAAAGAASAFVVNMLLYVPMIIAFAVWRPQLAPPRLPPEGLGGAIISGVRYVMHSPAIRIILVRTLLLGVLGGAVSALLPLVARDLIGGGAMIFGVLLGAFGVGAVLGALTMASIRARFASEQVVRVSTLVLALTAALVAFSSSAPLSVVALVVNGAAWMVAVATFNIELQLAAPRWVGGRTLAFFQAAIAGGMAIGGIVWGQVAEAQNVRAALLVSGVAMAASLLLAIWLRMPRTNAAATTEAVDALSDPEIAMELTPRSGPIVIMIEYRVDPEQARLFYGESQKVARARKRNGAYGWSISRDIADPELWTERYHCPTWHDYLRQRGRATQAERELQLGLMQFHKGPAPARVRRMLERPLGSVRWRDDTPDIASDTPIPGLGPGGL